MIHCDFLFYLIKKILLILLVTKKVFLKKKKERKRNPLKFGISAVYRITKNQIIKQFRIRY